MEREFSVPLRAWNKNLLTTAARFFGSQLPKGCYQSYVSVQLLL